MGDIYVEKWTDENSTFANYRIYSTCDVVFKKFKQDHVLTIKLGGNKRIDLPFSTLFSDGYL